MKKSSFLEKILGASAHRDQFWATRTLPAAVSHKIEPLFPTTNLLASRPNHRLYSPNHSKQPFCRLRQPVFSRFWSLKRLLNQTKVVVCHAWHSFWQTANLPPEAFLWI